MGRYLRACLLQYLGTGASAILPPRSASFSGPLGTAPPASFPAVGSLASVALSAPSSDTSLLAAALPTSQSLSPSAPPFWPTGQPWQDIGGCYSAGDDCSSIEQQLQLEVPASCSLLSVADDLRVPIDVEPRSCQQSDRSTNRCCLGQNPHMSV